MFVHRCVLILALSVVAPLFACGSDDPNCPEIAGSYEPLYIPLSGTCGAIEQPHRVPFDGGQNGVNTIMERRVNSSITTEIVHKGCSVRMTQTVTDKDGRVASQIDGETIVIETPTELNGQVTMTIYDEVGAVACSGTYDALFTKNTTIIGAAAL